MFHVEHSRPPRAGFFTPMPCTHNCNQGRACTCSAATDASLLPAFLAGFTIGSIFMAAAIAFLTTL